MKSFTRKLLAVGTAVLIAFGGIPFKVKAADTATGITATDEIVATTADVNITLNGVTVTGYAENVNDHIFFPLTFVAESFGITAKYPQEGKYDPIITMTKGNKKVYHKIGTLVTSADIPSKTGSVKKIIATTDAPSYWSFLAGFMVDINLISESFTNEGISAEWISSTRTVAITVQASAESQTAQADPATPEDTDELIWLDAQTSVNKTKLFNRLLNDDFTDGSFPTVKEFIETQPINEVVVSKEYLFQTAKGYIEGIYNINYQTDTAAKVDAVVSQYYTETIKEALVMADNFGKEYDHIDFQEAQKQQLIMETVFVTDESLIYAEDETKRGGGFITEAFAPGLAAEVRGTMFYRFTSNNNQGKYWNAEGPYELGQWYWSDIGVQFYKEVGSDGQVQFVLNAGGPAFYDWENGSSDRNIRDRHIELLSTMPEEPYLYWGE